MKYLFRQVCLFSFIFLFPFLGHTQNTGIKFQSGLSWPEIQAKAKAENKLIFIDFFVDSNDECRYMETKIYPDQKVGDFFNTHFVNLRLRMDSTPRGAIDVRDWDAGIDSIVKKFRIKAYPTYLFFSADGQALHKVMGYTETGIEFITKAAAALDAQSQYFTLLAGWESHKTDSAYLLYAILAAKACGDDENTNEIFNCYVGCLRQPVTKYNSELIYDLIYSPRHVVSEPDKAFDLYLNNAGKINELFHKKGLVETALTGIIFKTEIAPVFHDKTAIISFDKVVARLIAKYQTLEKTIFAARLEEWFSDAVRKEIYGEIKDREMQMRDWNRLSQRLKPRFPDHDWGQVFLGNKIRYYYERRSWEDCAKVAIMLINRYNRKLKDASINDIAWKCIFQHSMDQGILNKALGYMRQITQKPPEKLDVPRLYDQYLDTYANLLYKTGHNQEAIDWEEKVIHYDQIHDQIHEGVPSEFIENLVKMRKGEPTWSEERPGS
jgi:thioredoxin-related protein